MAVLSYVSQPKPNISNDSIAANAGTTYSLTMVNQSAADWTFYVYQKAPQPSADVFSLAWFASPFVIVKGNQITFKWHLTYDFVWSATGQLLPGVDFSASGIRPASPNDNNTTNFDTKPGPHLSTPVPGQPTGSLVIQDSVNVPNNTYSVGIGMSGTGTYAVQAGRSLKHTFTPTPSYWVAAGTNVQIGTVLNITTITPTAEVLFGPNVFSMTATLDASNNWTFKNG